MNKLLSLYLAVIMATFSAHAQTDTAAAPTQATETQQEQDLAELGPFVDATVKAYMQAHDVPAGTVSIVKDGSLIFAKGYGMSDIEAQTPTTAENTLFRPGSVSKLFTWTAVMQQVEEGKLDLHTDVNQYLKSFQIPDTYDEPITLHHILTHTAGFEEGGLGYLIILDEENIISLQEAMAKYIPRRINKPGAYSSYSNYATALAGLIVENVSGIPFNDYIEQKILSPLGMTNSTFAEPLPDHLNEKMATGYKRKLGINDAKPFEIVANFGPAGALSSTATDMAKFMIAHLNNGTYENVQILKPETAQLMHQRIYAPDNRVAGMAYGFYETFVNGHRLIGHGGDTTLFHSDLALDKEEGLGIFVSFVGDGGAKARSAMVPAIYNEFFPAPTEVVTPPADFNERAGKFAGMYKFWRHNQSGIEKAGGIAGGLEVVPTGDGTLLISGLFEPRQFVEVDKNLFRQVDGKQKVVFTEGPDGSIQDFNIDGYPFMAASRAPAFEGKLFSQILPIAAFAIFLSAWLGWFYRRAEYKLMPKGENTAIKLSLGMSAANLLFVITLAFVLTAYAETLYVNVPFALTLVLILPNIAALLSIGILYFAYQAWKKRYWRTGRRIHYSLIAASAAYMTCYYYYWNLVGIQLPG